MNLTVLDGEFAVARLDAWAEIPGWATAGGMFSVTRTAGELSVICVAAAIPAGVRAERGWRCLCVAGPLPLSMTGVLSSLLVPLAAAGVSILAVSTHDTDHVLVPARSLPHAVACLRAAGHDVSEEKSDG